MKLVRLGMMIVHAFLDFRLLDFALEGCVDVNRFLTDDFGLRYKERASGARVRIIVGRVTIGWPFFSARLFLACYGNFVRSVPFQC